ncbi:hypothetical protein ACVRZD_04235 [Streptococcus hongkongensis]|nr:hypothetical protein NC01_01335 [Streptococcus uberis]
MKTSQKALLSTLITISITTLIGFYLKVSLVSIFLLQFMTGIFYMIVYFGTVHYKNKPTNYHQISQIMRAHLKRQYKLLLLFIIPCLILMFSSPHPYDVYFYCNLCFVMLQLLHLIALNGVRPQQTNKPS